MKLIRSLLFIFIFITGTTVIGQNKKTDSLVVVLTFKTLLYICKNVDYADPKTLDSGLFYKAAPFIIYHGSNNKRAWKDFAKYHDPEEKKGVDAVCARINNSVNRDSAYKIVKYLTEKQSEGIWHVLLVTYLKRGVEKKAAFAFLRIGRRYGLGDID